MKQHMMIVGCKIISSNPRPELTIFKLTLTELTTVKRKISIGDIIGGDLDEVIDDVKSSAQKEHIVYISMKEWVDSRYKIGSHVTLEMLRDDTTGGIK